MKLTSILTDEGRCVRCTKQGEEDDYVIQQVVAPPHVYLVEHLAIMLNPQFHREPVGYVRRILHPKLDL